MMTTIWRVHLLVLNLVLVAVFSAASFAENSNYPIFRHVDANAVAPTEALPAEINLLADEDFAPFSFRKTDGSMAGLAVELAAAACAEIRATCKITAVPFAELLPNLLNGKADILITGLRTTSALMEKLSETRPFYFSSGLFVSRTGSSISTPDIRSLAGRRVGLVKGTSHEAFLMKYYDRSALTSFASEASMFEALRIGNLDAAFTDSLRAQFWLKGAASRGCCMALGKALIDRSTISRNMTFMVRNNQTSLREYFDFALDKVVEKGVSAKIFQTYLAGSPF